MAVITNFQAYPTTTSSIKPIIPISFSSMISNNGLGAYITPTSSIVPIIPITNTQVNYRDYNAGFTGGSVRLTAGQTITDATNTIALGANSTIEMWVWTDSLPTSSNLTPIIAKRANTSTSPPDWLFLYFDSNGYLTLQVSSASVPGAWGLTVTGTQQISKGRWNHIAIVRQSTTTWTVYLNGAFYVSGTVSGAINSSTTTLVLGAADSTRAVVGSFGLLQGYITGLRINISTALYTSTFTPTYSASPTLTQAVNVYGTPSAAISSGTVLLVNPTYGSATVTDDSGTSRTFTGGTINYLTAIEGVSTGWTGYSKPTSSIIPIIPIQPFSTVVSGSGQTTTEMWI
jgi:hypothetical protein